MNRLTVGALGAPGDSILIDGESASDLHLPLRVSADQTQWRLTFMVSDSTFVTDTITMRYTPIEYFASMECGAMYHFDLKEVTTTQHVIDSVVVTQPHVTHTEQVNLRIYLPTN